MVAPHLRRELPGRLAPPPWIGRGIVLALVVVAWQACASLSELGGNRLLVASPVETAAAFGSGWLDGSLARPTWETLRALILGVASGALVGAIFALLAPLTRFGERLLRLMASIMKPLPSVAV